MVLTLGTGGGFLNTSLDTCHTALGRVKGAGCDPICSNHQSVQQQDCHSPHRPRLTCRMLSPSPAP